MSQRSGPVAGRHGTRRVKVVRPLKGDPNGNRAQRRLWAKSNPQGPKSNETPPEAPEAPQRAYPDRDTRTGRTAAHGPTGRHDGHSTDDSDDPGCPHCGLTRSTHYPNCDYLAGTQAIAAATADITERPTP